MINTIQQEIQAQVSSVLPSADTMCNTMQEDPISSHKFIPLKLWPRLITPHPWELFLLPFSSHPATIPSYRVNHPDWDYLGHLCEAQQSLAWSQEPQLNIAACYSWSTINTDHIIGGKSQSPAAYSNSSSLLKFLKGPLLINQLLLAWMHPHYRLR